MRRPLRTSPIASGALLKSQQLLKTENRLQPSGWSLAKS